MANTKAQLQAEIDKLRGDMVELAEYLRRASARRDVDARDDSLPEFSRGLAGGASDGFALAADWIIEELSKPR